MNAVPSFGFTPETYLEWEARQSVKHEYLAGETFAMVGARDAHVTVAGNVFALLRAHNRDTPCRTYIADMKLEVAAAEAFFYPDVFVTCDPRDLASETWKTHARLVVEVLSDSTEAFDRGRKFQCYRLLESLREYVLIDIGARVVEVFRRDTSGHWVLWPFEGEGVSNSPAWSSGRPWQMCSRMYPFPLNNRIRNLVPLPMSRRHQISDPMI